ncbi:MAG: polysaccharide deacetylase family protein [Arcobacteraceae bacterium]
MRVLLLLAVSYFYLFADAHVFIYHRFGDDRHPSTNTSLQELEKEFEYFKENNYEVVPLEQIIQKLKQKEEIPSNWIALTVDDAYKSFYKNGLPLFKKYNYPFTLYVYVEATHKGYSDFMSWEELKQTQKYGTLALHGYDHKHLTNTSKKEIQEDTLKGIELFETHLGYKPTSYAYAYGEYNQAVLEVIAEFGFESIVNQNSGSVNAQSSPLDINRIALVGEVDIKEKLKYNSFEATWIEPKIFPEDGILKRVIANVDPSFKTIKLYVTGHGWKEIKVKNGIIDEFVEIPLKNNRTRVILSPDYYTINTQLLIK